MFIFVSNFATTQGIQAGSDDHDFDPSDYTTPMFYDAIATDSVEVAASWIADQKAACEQEVLEELESHPEQPSLLPEPEVVWTEESPEWDGRAPERQSKTFYASIGNENVATLTIIRLVKETR